MKLKNIRDNVKDYLKCTWANKATLASYLLLGTYILSRAIGIQEDHSQEILRQSVQFISGLGSFELLLLTWGGANTFHTYRRAKKHIEQFEELPSRYIDLKGKWYCTKVAVRLAAKEAGLENQLLEK